MSSLQLFRRLFSYSRRYWLGFVVATLAMLVLAITETSFPALLKPLLDRGFSGATAFEAWWVPTAVLVIFATRGISSFVASYAMSWIAANVLRDLRQSMFNKILSMPAPTFDRLSSGQLISKIIAEVNGVTSAATNVVNTLVRDSMILLGLLGWLIWLNWKLTLIVLALIPFLAGLTWAFSKRMRRVSRGALEATSNMTRSVEEAIFGHRVIKIFEGEAFEAQRFGRANADYRGQTMRLAIAQALQSPVSQMIAAVGVAVVLTIALMQSRSGEATVGDFVSFVTAMLMMFGPLRHLADINSQLQRGLAAAEAVFALIDERSENDSGRLELNRVKGYLEFAEVNLAYPGSNRLVLRNFSLKIRAGENIALVGPSGSGKSSVVNLVPRLYDVTAGKILLDGVPITELKLASLRAQIALVSQDVVLFNDTIRNNIRYGFDCKDDQELLRVIEAADLKDFVSSLDDGLNTIIGDRGIRLSGGQRQRIAIARAMLKNAPILILDEATSALDAETEANVKLAIDRLRANRTTLIIAHRLSTIQNADTIVVLEKGQIVETGTHDMLLAKAGLYARLYGKKAISQKNLDLKTGSSS